MTRATVYQTTQIGLEDDEAPGTPVAADTLLLATAIEPSAKLEITTIRPFGGKFPTSSVVGKDWSSAKISGQMTYNDLTYLLASLLTLPTPTPAGDGYEWVFTPEYGENDAPATFTVESGSSEHAGRFAYGLVTGLTLTMDRNKAELSGEMIGQAYEDDVTMTASPTPVDIVPILPSSICIYADGTSEGLGTTKLERVLSAELAITDRYAPLWALDCEVAGFVTHVETPVTATLKLLVEADTAGMALLTAARASTKTFISIVATGPAIDLATDYSLTIDLCGAVTDVGEFSDQDGVYAIEFTFQVVYDGDWGKALEVTLVNEVAAITTPA